MGDELKTIKLAAAQVSSVFLDREATVEKACRFIREAGANGADVIGFPENFIPAHPSWYTFMPASSDASLQFARRLFQNAVEIPGPVTDALCAACAEAGVTAIVGMCEKRPNTTGTMYATQLFIGSDGNILGKHQKLVATSGERLVLTGGFGDTLTPFATSFGNVSGLICGENSNPLAVYAILARNTLVHVASWPPHFSGGLKMVNSITAASRGIAYSLSAFVINSTGAVTDEAIEAYAQNDDDRAFLEAARQSGSASIVGPTGAMIVEAETGGDQILYAEVDLNDVLIPKLFHDFSGHYNRFDIFSVTINRNAPPPLVEEPAPLPPGEPSEPAGSGD